MFNVMIAKLISERLFQKYEIELNSKTHSTVNEEDAHFAHMRKVKLINNKSTNCQQNAFGKNQKSKFTANHNYKAREGNHKSKRDVSSTIDCTHTKST